MFNLFLDVTQNYCHIAIFNKRDIIKNISIKTNNNLTDLVVEHIDKLIRKSKITYKNINSLYILIGPGSFTGVKVATTIAKTWLVVNKVNIYMMNSLRFQIPSNSGISVIDAKSNKWYMCVIKNSKYIIKPKLITNDELKKTITKYEKLHIYKNFNDTNVFNNLLLLYKKFTLLTSIKNLKPLYIKNSI